MYIVMYVFFHFIIVLSFFPFINFTEIIIMSNMYWKPAYHIPGTVLKALYM